MSFAPSRAQMGLGSLCGMLALAIVYELSAPLPPFAPPRIPRHDHETAASAPTLFLPPPQTAFAAVNARPIFSPDRKAVVVKPVGPAAAPPPPPSVALIGVILDARNRLALVKSSASPLEVSVGVGGNVDGWQVQRIEPDRIMLGLGAATDEIKLEANRAKPGTTAPPAGADSGQPAFGRSPTVQTSTSVPPPLSYGPLVAPGQSSGTPASPARAGAANPPMLPIPAANGTDKRN